MASALITCLLEILPKVSKLWSFCYKLDFFAVKFKFVLVFVLLSLSMRLSLNMIVSLFKFFQNADEMSCI